MRLSVEISSLTHFAETLKLDKAPHRGVRPRYGWQLQRLPATCECGPRFTMDHTLSCKKRGFISLRHKQIRDLTANLLKIICRDVLIEPKLQQLTRESLREWTANITDKARINICSKHLTEETAKISIIHVCK